MTRIGWLLTALLCVLLGVGWYFLVFSPTSEEIEDVRAETDRVSTQAESERQRAQALREVRLAAPEAEADLAAGRTMIPDDPAIPALFRQMQQASDDAGVRLNSLSPSTPSEVDVGDESVVEISVSMSVEGTYFQLVDLARRIEDPQLTPRAFLWQSASISVGDHPMLNASLSGRVYARAGAEVPELIEEPEEPEEPEDDEAEDDDLPPLDEDQDGAT